MSYHNPVLLFESIDGLEIVPDGIYVDVTFGGGGHSKEILKRQGVEMETEASHGGMETGILKGLLPDLDIITYGPIAEGCHTPEEKLNLESFQKAYKNLCDLIAEL